MATKKKNKTKAKAKATALRQVRKLKHPKYNSFKVSKRIKSPQATLPSVWKLAKNTVQHLILNWKLFGGIILVYAVLSFVLVKGFSMSSTLPQAKQLIQASLQGSPSSVKTGLTLFGVLLGSSSSSASAGPAYQSILLIVVSLAVVWALRQSYANTRVKVRDAFYNGMYPVIPCLLILIVIALELLPLLMANMLYGFVFGNGLAVTALEKVLWALLVFLLAVLSFYMITSAIFALYVATLPGVSPMQALRSARELVRYRRWTVMRKLLFLPIALIISSGLIMLPILIYATGLAEWIYFGLGMGTLVLVHSYIYSLYRELLN